jgi:hypothetical protein
MCLAEESIPLMRPAWTRALLAAQLPTKNNLLTERRGSHRVTQEEIISRLVMKHAREFIAF